MLYRTDDESIASLNYDVQTKQYIPIQIGFKFLTPIGVQFIAKGGIAYINQGIVLHSVKEGLNGMERTTVSAFLLCLLLDLVIILAVLVLYL